MEKNSVSVPIIKFDKKKKKEKKPPTSQGRSGYSPIVGINDQQSRPPAKNGTQSTLLFWR